MIYQNYNLIELFYHNYDAQGIGGWKGLRRVSEVVVKILQSLRYVRMTLGVAQNDISSSRVWYIVIKVSRELRKEIEYV